MKGFLIFLVLSLIIGSAFSQLPSDAVNANQGRAPTSLDLRNINSSVFDAPEMVNVPIIWTMTKNDTPVGYYLIHGSKLVYQNVTDYVGLTSSLVIWKDAPVAPIGSV